MDRMGLQSLMQMIDRSNGYIGINRTTQELKTDGTTFVGRIVTWVRFKFNRDYKEAVLLAKGKVKDLLLSDRLYGRDFEARINELDPQGSIFYKNKPLSARKVHRFISDVQQNAMATKIDRAQGWVDWYSGKIETMTSGENFEERTDAMIAEKIRAHRGISAADVDIESLGDEVNIRAREDTDEIETIACLNENEQGQRAQNHVDKILSEVLDRRIDEAGAGLRDELNTRLDASGLDGEVKQAIVSEIDDTTIATSDELKTRINEAVIKQMGSEFDGLLKKVGEDHNFNEQPMRMPEVKEQLQAKLAQQNEARMLSVADAREQATGLLSRWLSGKKEAIEALRPSQYTGVDSLLKKLVLQDPYIGKPQIEAVQQDMEETLDEIYNKDAAACQALGMDKGKILSKIHQIVHKETMLADLKVLSKQAPKPDSVFESRNWEVADVKAMMRSYAKDIIIPLIKGHKQVSGLKGKIPDRIHPILIDRIKQGDEWGPEFISIANQLNIDTLNENNHRELYRVLQTSEVAGKAIGSRDDLSEFTLDDLLKVMLPAKDIDNPEKRRQAIDKLIPSTTRDQLLDKLETQLGMVKSRVMDEKDVTALFQRGARSFLRDLKINFEHQVATAEAELREPSYVRLETPL